MHVIISKELLRVCIFIYVHMFKFMSNPPLLSPRGGFYFSEYDFEFKCDFCLLFFLVCELASSGSCPGLQKQTKEEESGGSWHSLSCSFDLG